MSKVIIIELDNDDSVLKAISSMNIKMSEIMSSKEVENNSSQITPVKRFSQASATYEAHRDEIIEMLRKGETQVNITKKFGFSTTFLQLRLKEERKSNPQITLPNVVETTVPELPRRKKVHRTRVSVIYEANHDQIIEMRRKGEFIKTIADKFGFSETSLRRRLGKERMANPQQEIEL